MKTLLLRGSKPGIPILCSIFVMALFSCSKQAAVQISTPIFSIGQSVKPGNISGTVKGTLLSDSVYYVTSDIVINSGDTLYIQPGAKIYFKGNYNFWIHGNLLSIGTKAKPVYFTVQGQQKMDVVGQDPTTDPAYKGMWGGLQGDTSTQFMILKYTHVEFGGGLIGTAQTFGTKNGSLAAPIRFVNTNGMLVVEDSWLYGEVDGGAAISVASGKFSIMRNVFEKCGFSGGECVEFKNGSQGNIAYNLMIGSCTNGIKASNGSGILSQVNVTAYNNTIINGGFRRFVYGGAGNSTGRGGSIDFEQAGRGSVYNNLIADCRYGLRIVNTFSYAGNNLTIADTANMHYSNNYNYGDSLAITDQVYPVDCLTKPMSTDIPNPSFLPGGYALGAAYDGSALIGANNPKFVNFTLPVNYGSSTVNFMLGTIAFAAGFDFHLQASSPCVGKGTTNVSISTAVTKIDPIYGATEITAPGADMGCYQTNGSGLKN
jgi:hypothetical protein